MLLIVLVAAGIGFTAGYLIVGSRPLSAPAQIIIVQTNTSKKSLKLEVPLRRKMAGPTSATATGAPTTVTGPNPREILERLEQTKLRPGPEQSQNIRRVIQLFEELTDCGPAALPGIREFLARNLESDYEEDTDEIRSGWRDGMTTDFLLPPSLRLGLLRTAQRIGGGDAEHILVDVLNSTGRGVETAYITRLLEEIAPQKYKEAVLATAHELLTRPALTGELNRLDRRDQEWLFGVLRLYQDASFAQQAQARLIRDDGTVDSSALGYLNDALKGKSVPMLTLAYQDNRLTNNGARFQIAYTAVRYVGVESAADQFLQTVLEDPKNSGDMMSELIRSLSERGLENRREPSDLDLQVLAARQSLLENFLVGHPKFKRTEDLTRTIRLIGIMRSPTASKPKER